jgi:hypothetical protein
VAAEGVSAAAAEAAVSAAALRPAGFPEGDE